MKNLFILYILTIASITGIYCQQIPSISQYTLNTYLINPAATGTTSRMPVSFTYRKLWAGITNSPSLQFLTVHSKVAENMGLGAKVYGFQLGPEKKTGFEATYSYHVNINEGESKLAFGLSAQVYQYFLNKSEFNVEESGDEVFLGKEKMVVPDASFGVYFYNTKYFAGLSVPQLINRNINLKNNSLHLKQVRHYYLNGGYNFELNENFKLEPSLLLKFIEAGLFQADINTTVTFKDMLMFGLSYRTSEAVLFRLGYKNDGFTAGYSFDLAVNGLGASTLGSHELMLIYSFNNLFKKE